MILQFFSGNLFGGLCPQVGYCLSTLEKHVDFWLDVYIEENMGRNGTLRKEKRERERERFSRNRSR